MIDTMDSQDTSFAGLSQKAICESQLVWQVPISLSKVVGTSSKQLDGEEAAPGACCAGELK